MLTHLTIRNYALIKHLEFNPSSQLNVITGETGAGKSIMLGALGLLLGNRADTKALWDENEKCITEGTFQISSYQLNDFFEAEGLDYDEQTVLRREISPNGKSRAFINDTPVTLDVMRTLGNRLMDIHSQHETLELGSKAFQLSLIDSFASNAALRDTYAQAWKTFTLAKKEYENLLTEAASLKAEADFVFYQLEELVKAELQPGELEKLESELKVLEHAEEIKVQFNGIIEQLGRSEYSVTTSLSSVRTQLNSIASYSQEYSQLYQRVESIRIELNDILAEIEQAEEKIEFDPQRIEHTKSRLDLLYQLLHKHRVKEISQLTALRDSLQEKADKTTNLDSLVDKAKENLAKAEKELTRAAKELTKSRKEVFTSLTKQLVTILKDLGIPDAALAIEHTPVPPSSTGADSMEVLFSANKGVTPRPLAQVASGGEFSRLMFSIKYVMAEKTALPTLILDEIDTGVSGEVAMRLGKRMKEIAKRHQVIAISHLPQIAAKADAHFFVYKENAGVRTMTSIRKLAEAERVTEIATMIGGAKPSSLALENAKELMQS